MFKYDAGFRSYLYLDEKAGSMVWISAIFRGFYAKIQRKRGKAMVYFARCGVKRADSKDGADHPGNGPGLTPAAVRGTAFPHE